MRPYTHPNLPIQGLDKDNLFPLIGTTNKVLSRYDYVLMGIIKPAVITLKSQQSLDINCEQ